MQGVRLLMFSISIHSLLAEGDDFDAYKKQIETISIHSLLAEGDLIFFAIRYSSSVFQSTPSSRRETFASARPPCAPAISIHSLLAEGDAPRPERTLCRAYFNPLPPRGGRLRLF